MKSLIEEANQIRQKGMEQAAVLWEKLEEIEPPLEAVNVYKAACSLKCAEFMARLRGNPLLPVLLRYLNDFLERTLEIAGEDMGSGEQGMRVIKLVEAEMPLTPEIYGDPAAYAQRQHTFDGVIILAAAKMGKEQETKAAIESLQSNAARAAILNAFRRMGGFDLAGELRDIGDKDED